MTESVLRRREEGIDRTLREIMDGVGPVYFSPPARLTYPCVLYEIASRTSTKADDTHYLKRTQYTITFITPDPDSDIPDKIIDAFNYISLDRVFVSDRLYHFVYNHYE